MPDPNVLAYVQACVSPCVSRKKACVKMFVSKRGCRCNVWLGGAGGWVPEVVIPSES